MIKTKVCIVGSGIAGSLCAKFLSTAVNDILIVERGARVSHEWRLQTGMQEKPIPTAEHHHVVKGELNRKNIQYIYAMGGTTNVWMGHTPRMMPSDFRMKSLFGITEDWPIGYEELEPYYVRAEEEMSIAGAEDNRRIPRSKGYPLAAHPFSPVDLMVKRCFPEGDVVSLPQARPTAPVGNRPACCGSAVCALCPVDSKYTALNTHIPELEKTSAVRFLTETVVVSLESDGQRSIRRAHAKSGDGSDIIIEASIFILAANAVENAALVLRSSGLKHHALLGKNLFDHPVFVLTAKINQDGFPNYGYSISTALCYSFYDGNFRNKRASALALVKNSHNVNDFATQIALNENLRGSDLHQKVTYEFRNQIGLTFMFDDVPNPENAVKIGNRRNQLGIPQTEIFYNRISGYAARSMDHISKTAGGFLEELGLRETVAGAPYFAGHLLGTCKMGSESGGVVDQNLRYHHYNNLYIAGGSAFPTYSPANPTLTIAALAVRLGSHLQNAL